MEQIRALPTREIQDIVFPTFGAYVPLLVANAANIRSATASKQTYAYGSNPRQQLDVYLPSSAPHHSRQKVLMFVYGGGFVNGDRTLPIPPLQGLVHANLGAFFSQQGYTVVIPDYRLLGGQHGEVKFPSGGVDISLAVEWVLQNPDKLLSQGGSTNGIDLFMLGNSVGGVHTSTFLLHDDFQNTRAKLYTEGSVRLRGVGLLGTPFGFQSAQGGLSDTVKQYFGDSAEHDSPLGLLNAKTSEPDFVKAGVKVLVLDCELDPQTSILDPNERFVEAYKAKVGHVDVKRIPGHNHISVIPALGTGIAQEEAWGKELVDWMNQA